MRNKNLMILTADFLSYAEKDTISQVYIPKQRI